MKRKFYFHRQNAPLDTDHVVYVVWCGESVREQKILASMVAWSFQHGATLMSWCEDIDYYLMLEAERVFPSKGLLDFGFIQANIQAKDLLILMEDNSFESYEKALTVPKAFFQQISILDPIRVSATVGRDQRHHVLTSSRKNLSDAGSMKPNIISFI